MSTTHAPIGSDPTAGPATRPSSDIPPSRDPAAARRGRRLALIALAAVVLVLLAAVGTAAAWGSSLRSENRLLPGVHVDGVDVGGRSSSAAHTAAAAVVDARLDRAVTVTHEDGRTWVVTPRELGATSDLTTVVQDAVRLTSDATALELTRLRWAGPAGASTSP
jgi:hypothetical protein